MLLLEQLQEQIRLARACTERGDQAGFRKHHEQFKRLMSDYLKAASRLKKLKDGLRLLPLFPLVQAFVC
ncbi:MAG: hypothetical protein H0W83_11450 [Planctomycetes bacterium]|nr:hypothetical protein [Planctomycetota bacterium]